MVAVHLMQMKLSGQALNGGNPEPRSCAIAGKLARTYAMQLETMAKLKGVVLLLALASCQPPDREIVVRIRNGKLVADFPWSVWRLIGLQTRTYCIRRVELFGEEAVLWSLNVPENEPVYYSCLDVRMPLPIGHAVAGFVSKGRPQLRSEQVYGVAIDGTGNARVAFALRRAFYRTSRNQSSSLNLPAAASSRALSVCHCGDAIRRLMATQKTSVRNGSKADIRSDRPKRLSGRLRQRR